MAKNTEDAPFEEKIGPLPAAPPRRKLPRSERFYVEVAPEFHAKLVFLDQFEQQGLRIENMERAMTSGTMVVVVEYVGDEDVLRGISGLLLVEKA